MGRGIEGEKRLVRLSLHVVVPNRDLMRFPRVLICYYRPETCPAPPDMVPYTKTSRSFVYSFSETMDFCRHPELVMTVSLSERTCQIYMIRHNR